MQLTPHFQLSEFTNSPTAQARHIDNTPSAQVIDNLRTLCQQVLEPLRTQVGVPVHITSGYRSPALNRAIGGVKNSQHMLGQAADIHIPDLKTGRRWFAILMDGPFDQLIWESKPIRRSPSSAAPTPPKQGEPERVYWIHVSFRQGHNRQQVLTINK